MKANEFRIGNVVWYNDGEDVMLNTIDASDIVIMSTSKDYTDLHAPIKFNRAWLEQKKWHDCGMITIHIDGLRIKMKEKFCRIMYQLNIEINTVHHLQNLYHALTGEELIIEEAEQ